MKNVGEWNFLYGRRKVMEHTSRVVPCPHGNINAPFKKVMSSASLRSRLIWLQTRVVIILSSRTLRELSPFSTTTTLARVPGHPANARTYTGCVMTVKFNSRKWKMHTLLCRTVASWLKDSQDSSGSICKSKITSNQQKWRRTVNFPRFLLFFKETVHF